MTQEKLQNGCLVTGYLNFFGRLTLNFHPIVIVDHGMYQQELQNGWLAGG